MSIKDRREEFARTARLSLRTLRAQHTTSEQGVEQSARLFVERLFRLFDDEGTGRLAMRPFVDGCMTFPLVIQCFDWLSAEDKEQVAAESRAARTFEEAAKAAATQVRKEPEHPCIT